MACGCSEAGRAPANPSTPETVNFCSLRELEDAPLESRPGKAGFRGNASEGTLPRLTAVPSKSDDGPLELVLWTPAFDLLVVLRYMKMAVRIIVNRTPAAMAMMMTRFLSLVDVSSRSGAAVVCGLC